MVEKHGKLPEDIRWHAIGHLQTNKAKHVTGIANLVHAVDSTRLFDALVKHSDSKLDVLLQLHIATESSKHGRRREQVKLLKSLLETP